MMNSLAGKLLSHTFIQECEEIFQKHNYKVHSPKKRVARNCSTATREARRSTILLAFATLNQLGYKLQSPHHLREKHICALAKYWTDQGLAARTLHTRISMLRVFSCWIGKAGLVRDVETYFPGQDDLIHRHTVATTNLSWIGNGVQPGAVIEAARLIDEEMACCLSLQDAFGLRVKESIELRPRKAVDYDRRFLFVTDGTKGGRPRLVEIKRDAQREALAWAIRLADSHHTGRVRWRDLTWKQAQGRYYRLAARLGITKENLGVTSHGLRHGRAQRDYRELTGLPTPIDGGALGAITAYMHRRAAVDVSRNLGHGRISVTTAYCGSYGHQLRATTEQDANADSS